LLIYQLLDSNAPTVLQASELLTKLSRVDLPQEHNSSWPSVVELARLYTAEAPT